MCRSFPLSMISCIVEQRAPTVEEIDEVARRFWEDCLKRDGGDAWHNLPAGCPRRKLATVVAEIAIGGHSVDLR
jgi:hypothetical protein